MKQAPIETIINQLWENILHQQENLQVVKQMGSCSLEPKIGEKRSVLTYDMEEKSQDSFKIQKTENDPDKSFQSESC